jgi:hypothetical protein
MDLEIAAGMGPETAASVVIAVIGADSIEAVRKVRPKSSSKSSLTTACIWITRRTRS